MLKKKIHQTEIFKNFFFFFLGGGGGVVNLFSLKYLGDVCSSISFTIQHVLCHSMHTVFEIDKLYYCV